MMDRLKCYLEPLSLHQVKKKKKKNIAKVGPPHRLTKLSGSAHDGWMDGWMDGWNTQTNTYHQNKLLRNVETNLTMCYNPAGYMT